MEKKRQRKTGKRGKWKREEKEKEEEEEEEKWSKQMERSLSARQMDLSSVMEDVLRVFAQRL